MIPRLERNVHVPSPAVVLPRAAMIAAIVLGSSFVVLIGVIGMLLGREPTQLSPGHFDSKTTPALERQEMCAREREDVLRRIRDNGEYVGDIVARFEKHRLDCPIDAELSRLYLERLYVDNTCDPSSRLSCELDVDSREATLAKARDEVFDCSNGEDDQGRVQVDVEVNELGVVTSAIPTEAPDEATGLCVARALHTVNFGRTQLGGTFTYTIDF